jgi:zinc transporter 9
MSSAGSMSAVVAALLGNSFVTVIKLIAFGLSGSGAMLSEAIHSAADTGNQVLLFIGLRRGEREADDRFHYGYGGERFVFGMLSAAGIFFLGCGITLYHGVSSLLESHEPQLTGVTFLVLAISFVIEGGVLLFAIRSINKQRGDLGFWRYVRERADPATVAILLEDGAAVSGLAIAAGGIVLSYVTGNPVFDAASSIVVGVILGLVAYYLVRTNREHLLGRAVPEGIEDKFVGIILRQPCVRSVRDVKTRQLTPEAFSMKAEITLDNDYLADDLERALPPTLTSLEGKRRTANLRRITSMTTDRIATDIAAIESAVRAEIPQARHIDLEVAHPDALADDDDDEELA